MRCDVIQLAAVEQWAFRRTPVRLRAQPAARFFVKVLAGNKFSANFRAA
jgi:hypothetical protein